MKRANFALFGKVFFYSEDFARIDVFTDQKMLDINSFISEIFEKIYISKVTNLELMILLRKICLDANCFLFVNIWENLQFLKSKSN